MSRNSIHALPAFAAALVLAGVTFCASCGVSKNRNYWKTIDAYKLAPQVQHEPKQGHDRLRWNLELTLPNGVSVLVKAATGPFPDSGITVKYSDEVRERVVYPHPDYVYPVDIRIERNILYALVDGMAAGVWRHTRLIVYDLAARKALRQLKVDPKDVQ